MKRFIYAFKGIAHALKTQQNLRIHLLALILVSIAGWIFKIDLLEWGLIAAAAGLVLVAELFNTAVESLVDLVSPEFNEKAANIKDAAAGAVLIAAIASAIIGLLVFLPKILR